MKKTELSYKDLKATCNPNIFKFKTTGELETIKSGIGQERGINAFKFGLDIHVKGYNIYFEGPSGVGKTMYAKNYLDEIAKSDKVPQDWVYVYNFDKPNEPIAISFPAGKGKEFKEAMDNFITSIRKDLISTFSNTDFKKEKKIISKEFEDKKSIVLDTLNKKALEQGFLVKNSDTGIYMMPFLNGKALKEEEFDKLDDSVKKEFENKSSIVQEQIMEAISQIKSIDKESRKKIKNWQLNLALLTINVHLNSVKTSFKKSPKITKFLNDVRTDILKNLSDFVKGPQQQQNPMAPGPIPPAPWLNYRVNLFVDNSSLEGAPVIMDSNISYANLLGRIEYENYYGSLKTDHTMLKPGLLHMANGGYIIIQADDIIKDEICYEALKKALKIRQLNIENISDQHSSMVMISLKPEPIPLDVKVVIIGNSEIYQTLLAADKDFRKLFRIKVEFDEDAPRTYDNMMKLAKFAHGFCLKEHLPELDPSGMAALIDCSTNIANDKEKLSTRFNDLSEIIGEAATWAKIGRSKVITDKFIKKALDERIERVKKYDSKYLEMIKENTLLIDTSSSAVGQINGLTVITMGDYSFGKPAKITANTYAGKRGVVNIEREVDLSGSSHSKGVLILTGYLGQKFAQDFPLCLTASICFEQLYNGVDGDSASSTELYSLLSSLSELPINQSIAVTGSVNQKGEVQPIGGVNEKIEGFFQICQDRGLTGTQGVIIPIQNVRNLHLNDKVIEAVKEDKFHIYAISNIDEGIEILTGVPAGAKLPNGKFPDGTVNSLVYNKLKKFSDLEKESK